MIKALLAALTLTLAATLPQHVATASTQPVHRLCAPAQPGHMACQALVRPLGQTPDAGNTPPYSPQALRTAYSLPAAPPVPQLVGIVDAFSDPTLSSDLATYSARFSLPSCTVANGCLTVVNQDGATSPLPPADADWDGEISLDVQTVHGLCPNCRIILVSANSTTYHDLAAAVNTAVRLGANEVSNSYGGPEGTIDATAYDHPGVAIVASSGDDGYGVAAPASIPSVIAVGGTTLSLNPDGSYSSETAWKRAGSGCSALYPAQRWQTNRSDWHATGCGSMRAEADVSADADPQTGVAIYDAGQWVQAGGTSLASPIIASVVALAGGMAGISQPSSVPYAHASGFRDVTVGSNGSCGGASICTAGPGYDGSTGLGSPNGTGGFGARAPAPSPTPQPSPEPVPTSTPSPSATPVPPRATATPTLTPQPTATRPVPPPPPPVPVTPTATPRPTATPSPTPAPRHHPKPRKPRHCLAWPLQFVCSR